MGVVIQNQVWEPPPWLNLFLFSSSFVSIFGFTFFSNNANPSTAFDLGSSHSLSSIFLRFQRTFLAIYSLVSVLEGLQSVYGEVEYSYYGFTRDQMFMVVLYGFIVCTSVGTFLGFFASSMDQKKACVICCIFHLVASVLKGLAKLPLLSSICSAIASFVFSYSFEAWMVSEIEKLGFRRDSLNEMFWLMTFWESVALIGSQVIANWLISGNIENGVVFPSAVAAYMAIACLICIGKGWKTSVFTSVSKSHEMAFSPPILIDKRVYLLGVAQACVHFALTIFWLLWTPTIVADGREVNMGMIYPCLLGARMLGSTAFPWMVTGPFSIRTEDYVIMAFAVAGVMLFVPAFDYQEIWFLVAVFCIFHACVGFILPSLARLRSLFVPNDHRAAMMSMYHAVASCMVLLVLGVDFYVWKLGNACIMGMAVVGLFAAGFCIYNLRKPQQDHRSL
ncbi:hypothetical protein AMTRI_Chr09g41740 [Amborella trichopoda]|uniref:Major facilitator superfamily (MFS) profile domain-containing protein n=1 Tax=Amborella trichopoda TaxID=13333 RepID=W1PYI1_AMBTC|nr:molybdate-anion transporter [Amborella trichopoda]ERN13373.1 hypothetical protein AMTR_s00041p00157330 [Amborella trichopoda]|eukprot:XP_006851906.1 molybdate-anion transporter [Amborella trichopoda]